MTREAKTSIKRDILRLFFYPVIQQWMQTIVQSHL